MRYRAFLFDWDGTLADSLSVKVGNAARLFAAAYGGSPEVVEVSYRRHSGLPRRELFDAIAAECLGRRLDGAEFSGLSRAFSQANLESLLAGGSLRPSALPALEALRERGCLLFVSSSTPQEELVAVARHFGVEGCFQEVLGSRPGFSKGPEHVDHVRRAHRLRPDEMVGVGDEARDMHLYQAAGVAAIGVGGTEPRESLLAAGAALVVDDLRELVAYAA